MHEKYVLDYIAACQIAEKAHTGQRRFNGEPYINHCFRVAANVGDCYLRKATAMLHDVVEDTDITLSDLVEHGLNSFVIDAVDSLTKQRNQAYRAYIERLSKNRIATDVKIADLCDNMNVTQLPKVDKKAIARNEKYVEALMYLTRVKYENS